MKLILKQYLASLKERNELDALIPDLLSRMGLNVFISPVRGFKEYGVDIAAVGRIDDGVEKVYLFSVKSGNLTRSSWDDGSNQSLRRSLNEIQDSFIPSRLPPEHKGKPVVICLCFGGDISSGARQDVSGYLANNTKDDIRFEEWNGDKISGFIIKYLLQEELLPEGFQSMLRRSLALINEADSSFGYFKSMAQSILSVNANLESVTDSIVKVNLCLWILFSWCREEKNLESAYLSAEYVLLASWDKVKNSPGNNKDKKAFHALLETYHIVTKEYLESCILSCVDIKHAVSHLVSSPCAVDVNLKLFDVLGRLSLRGLWLLDELSRSYQAGIPDAGPSSDQFAIESDLSALIDAIKSLVKNNPLLLSPYKDSQAIDLGLALCLLSNDSSNDEFVKSWLVALVDRSDFAHLTNGMYPTNLEKYESLLRHKDKNSYHSDYKEKVTRGSILYPLLVVYCELYEQREAGDKINSLVKQYLGHCTLQYWFPDQLSEDRMYENSGSHGMASTDFPLVGESAINHVREECRRSGALMKMSAVKDGHGSLVLAACRCYRYPVPFHYLYDWLTLDD